MRRLRLAAQGGFFAATALAPVIAFVALLDPNGPLRGTRSPDPLPLPDATAGGLMAFAPITPLTFRDLDFRPPDEDRTTTSGNHFLRHAPSSIRALDGRSISIRGFMIPVALDGRNVRRCVIVPSQANCCYGQAPRFCEFIVARITSSDDVPLAVDVPMTFTGSLRVGKTAAEDDAWGAFYTMDCITVTP